MSGAVNHFIPVSGSAIVGFFAVVFILAAIARIVSRPPKVRAKSLLTDRERAALAIIERVLPHTRVYVQVSMGALLRAKAGLGQSEPMRTRNRFSQKIVDFVIEDRASGAILALVELDDRVFAPFAAAALLACTMVGLMLLIVQPGGQSSQFMAALLIGLTLGSEVDLMSFLVTRYFARDQFGRAYGILYGLGDHRKCRECHDHRVAVARREPLFRSVSSIAGRADRLGRHLSDSTALSSARIRYLKLAVHHLFAPRFRTFRTQQRAFPQPKGAEF